MDEGAGTLNLTTTKGIAIGSTNSLDNALSVGVDAPSQKTAITTTIARPPAGTGKYEQAGLWFGNNEDNYSKVVVSTRSGTIIEHLLEVNVGTVSSQKSGPLNLTGKAVTLKLVANPSDRTVTASYRIGTESEKTLGHVAPPGEFFSFDAAGIDPAIGTRSFAGIFATHRNGPSPLVYRFDRFTVSDAAAEAPPFLRHPVQALGLRRPHSHFNRLRTRRPLIRSGALREDPCDPLGRQQAGGLGRGNRYAGFTAYARPHGGPGFHS